MNLLQAKPLTVTFVGAGGLGVPAAWGLLETWLGPNPLHVQIFDPDSVQLSNLQRQILFGIKDLDAPKAERLRDLLTERARRLGKDSLFRFSAHAERIEQSTSHRLENSALILDCTDSVATKFFLNDYCAKHSIAFCYAGAVGFMGQLFLVDPAQDNSPCLRCLFPDFNAEDESCLGPTCQQAGILGPVVGEIGFRQAELAARFLQGETSSAGLFFKREGARVFESRIARNQNCLNHSAATAQRLDLREEKCPMTFLYTKLALEKLSPKQALEVQFGNCATATNICTSVIEEGYRVISGPEESAPNIWRLLISKGQV